MKRLKTLPFGAGQDVPREFQNRLTKRRINLLAAIFLPRRTPCCLLRFSRWHNARVILTLPLSEMYATVVIVSDLIYGNNSLCDRLRSYGNQPLIFASCYVCDTYCSRYFNFEIPEINDSRKFHLACVTTKTSTNKKICRF